MRTDGGLDTASQLSPSCERRFSDALPPYTAKHLLDLRLMHHYTIFTTDHFTKTFPERVSVVLKIDLPRLALDHEFLMDAILLVAVVHIACTESVPDGPLPVYLYRHQALRSLRQAVSDVTPENSNPVFCASTLLATVSFAADRIAGQSGLWMANWMTLVLGQRNIRGNKPPEDDHLPPPHPFTALAPARGAEKKPSASTKLYASNLYGGFADIPGPGVAPTDVQRALACLGDSDWAYRDTLHRAARDLGRLIATLEQPYEDPWLERQVKSWAFDMVPADFPELVRRAQPHALVIVAHYLVVFKLLPDLWTYQGVANHDLEEICNTIEPAWREYIAMPKMALRIDDKPTLAKMLVSSLRAGT